MIGRSFGVVSYRRGSLYVFVVRKHPAVWSDVIPALLRWRQNWFKASLGCIRPFLKERRKGRKEGGKEGGREGGKEGKPPVR